MNAPLPPAAERRIDLRETPEQKADRRRFTGERITAMGELGPDDSLVERIEAIWNLPPRTPAEIEAEKPFRSMKPRLSDVKREESEADARGEALWLARGGEA